MANLYDVGDLVRCTGIFTNAAGAAIDPAGVIARIKKPDNTIVLYTYGIDTNLIRASTGSYYVDVSALPWGHWHYRFEGVGSGQSAHEALFFVQRSAFSVDVLPIPPSYTQSYKFNDARNSMYLEVLPIF